MPGRHNGSVISQIILTLTLLISILSAQEQLNLAAIRVEFVEDQNDMTTGNGKFVLDADNIAAYTIDPPPHNRSYFEDQIVAVRNYFLAASHSQLQITGTVFPRSQNGAYQLPQRMTYYNPNTTDQENDAGLAELFIDALETADLDPDLDFSQYDLVVIFHAGVGKDIDLGFDETPQDIPSLYISPDFLKKSQGVDFAGIPVDDGTLQIDRGIILPETESQDDIQAALTGIFAANIGSHLGLFDLFSPTEELPGIGSFGLMDIGLFNVVGLIPALPSAFSRIYAKWDTPQIITEPDENIPVDRLTGSPLTGNTIYQIPINSDEYYLIEYRGDRTINIDSVYGVLANERQELPSYLEVLQKDFPGKIEISDSTGVVLKIDDYDCGLPGSGILIWHIDESVINAKGSGNRINDDPEWRAVDLEEADGSQDIGYSYTIFEAGYQSEFGTWLDFWFEGNPAPLYQNEFSSGTSPNSRSNRNYANSHITLRNFSGNEAEVMTFSFARDFYLNGFPITLDSARSEKEYFSLGSAFLSGTSEKAIITSSESGDIYLIKSGGEGVLNPSSFIAAVFGQPDLPYLALADTNRDELSDLLITAGRSGRIELYSLEDNDNNELLDTLVTLSIGDSIATMPVVKSPYFYVGTKSNNLYRIRFSGSVDTVYSFSHPVKGLALGPDLMVHTSESASGVTIIDLNSDGYYDIVKWNGENTLNVTQGVDKSENIIILPDHPATSPVFADLDQNGYYEIVFLTAQKIFVLSYVGTPLPNMPVVLSASIDDAFIDSPIIADLNGDGQSDLLVSTRNGLIYGYSIRGKQIDGFPFTIGGKVANTVMVSDVDGDDQAELFAVNTNGSLFAWKLPSLVSEPEYSWYQSTYNTNNNRFIAERLAPVKEVLESLLPAQRVFNYPNPNVSDYTNIRYYLREDASVIVRIFDLAGDLVASFSGPGTGQSYNEIRWNVADISSGVYICRVEAHSANDKDVQLIKIMVVN